MLPEVEVELEVVLAERVLGPAVEAALQAVRAQKRDVLLAHGAGARVHDHLGAAGGGHLVAVAIHGKAKKTFSDSNGNCILLKSVAVHSLHYWAL